VDNLLEEKYPAKGLEAVLESYFGATRLKEVVAGTDVFITSYSLEKGEPFFFRSKRARTRPAYDFPMKAVARGTSAAPTYFEPLKLDDLVEAGKYYALVDGGVYANNPTMCGLVEAKAEHGAEDCLVVSLGTGIYERPIDYAKAKRWGLLGWAGKILDVVFDGVSDTVDFQMRQLLPAREGARRYYRFQVKLAEANQALDDVKPENLRALRVLAEAEIRTQSAELDALCRQLAGG
jgi:predicted acylesterase/phospholipase RssA